MIFEIIILVALLLNLWMWHHQIKINRHMRILIRLLGEHAGFFPDLKEDDKKPVEEKIREAVLKTYGVPEEYIESIQDHPQMDPEFGKGKVWKG